MPRPFDPNIGVEPDANSTLEFAPFLYSVCFVNIATIGAYYAVSCSTSIMILLVHGERARNRGRTGIVDRS